MAGEMSLHALWQQPFTATLTASSEGRPAALGFHPGAESMLLLARSF
jgi:hypothetical protein